MSFLCSSAVSALGGIPADSSHSHRASNFFCTSPVPNDFDLLKRLDSPNLEVRRFKFAGIESGIVELSLLRFELNTGSVGAV